MIIHAGDIGERDVLEALETIAPVKAVRGNNDYVPWADFIPHDQVIEHGSHLLSVLHELEHLDLDPAAAEFSAVIFGHSHCPLVETRNGVLYLNPGSAGPRRCALSVAVAKIHMTESGLTSEIIEFSI